MNLAKRIKERIKEKEHKLDVNSIYQTSIHNVLAHSYSFYFVAFLFGIILDFVYPVQSFDIHSIQPLGLILLAISTLLIHWAQRTSRNLKKEEISYKNFMVGPYKFSRMPTHLGIFILLLGFGIITNSFWVILFSFISFFITKMTFIKTEEKILEKKYGDPYLKYKNVVHL